MDQKGEQRIHGKRALMAGQADIELANALDRAAADRDERGGAA